MDLNCIGFLIKFINRIHPILKICIRIHIYNLCKVFNVGVILDVLFKIKLQLLFKHVISGKVKHRIRIADLFLFLILLFDIAGQSAVIRKACRLLFLAAAAADKQ